MKRSIFVGILLFFCSIAAVLNSSMAYAGTQDFTISDFQADYYLSRDSEGRSFLKTVESITAVFPNYDQNHGIERALPKAYDGHSVTLNIQYVKDENGIEQNYSLYTSDGNLVVRIGDADEYVYGQKTYVITYTQRDVTKYFADTNDDEFYWDVNGVGWSQPFSQVSATVHIDSSLVSKVSGKQACYYGYTGSTSICSIFLNEGKDLVTAFTGSLSADQNMTIAVGFQPHTFEGYKLTKFETFVKNHGVLLAAFSYVLLAIVLALRVFLYRHSPRRKAVIAQYVPPKDVELSTSAALLGFTNKIFSAAIISMAVKHNIVITEKKTKLFWGITIKQYNIELLSSDGLTTSEREVALMIFGNGLPTGPSSSVDFPKTDYELTKLVQNYFRNILNDLKKNGYYANKQKVILSIVLLSVLSMVSTMFISSIIVSAHKTLASFVSINVYLCGLIMMSMLRKKPFSVKGRELYDYLQGLRLFIKTTEQDRIKILQSPSGAERTAFDVNDGKSIIKLYEKLLPYAIIFGLEKEWSKVLAVYYTNQDISPAWYVGLGAFSASSLSSSLSSFSSSLGSSSSSGGSGGGGSSGGGGGGGGGGGW